MLSIRILIEVFRYLREASEYGILVPGYLHLLGPEMKHRQRCHGLNLKLNNYTISNEIFGNQVPIDKNQSYE